MALRNLAAVLAAVVAAATLGCGREMPAPVEEARADSNQANRSLQPVLDAKLERELAPRAQRILEAHGAAPIGTEVPFTHEGRPYVARIEMHNHPHGGPRKPWGPHRGVTVYAPR